MRGGRLRLVLVPLILGAACGDPAGTAAGNCSRFLELIEDMGEGEVETEQVFLERLDEEVGEFKEGSILRESHDRLLRYIEDGDEQQAFDETNFLVDTCLSVTDR